MNMATLGVGVPHTFQWEDLPTVIADLILKALARQLRHDVWGVSTTQYDEVREAMHRARLVNHAFADAVGYLWRLLPPAYWFESREPCGRLIKSYAMLPDAAPGFVEGVMRLAAESSTGRFVIHTHMYSMLYSTVYSSATMKPRHNGSEQLYNAIGTVASALAAEGAFRQLDTTKKRDIFVQLICLFFKYIDRFYVPRLGVRNIEAVLREALVTA